MSAVRDYYRDHHTRNDDLHKLLGQEPKLLSQLQPLRARSLSCCGPVPGKGGELKLAVVDPDSWDEVAREQAAIQEKLDAISTAVATIDGIFAEMEKAGIEIDQITPSGILRAAPRKDLAYQPGEYVNAHGKRCDKTGIPIKSQIDPRFIAWHDRANAALQEAQAIVDEQRQTSPVHAANPLTELAEKAKSLFA